MSRLPIPHIINTIKTKLGFDRTMTASGEDVVDAVNKQSQQIDNLKAVEAYVEDGDIASQTYTEGTFVLWKGLLYTVKPTGLPKDETISTTYLERVTDGGLNALQNNLNSLLLVESKSVFHEAASANTDITKTVSVAKSGYIPIGIVGYELSGAYSSRYHIVALRIQNVTNVYLYIRGTENSSLLSITAYVLYKKL